MGPPAAAGPARASGQHTASAEPPLKQKMALGFRGLLGKLNLGDGPRVGAPIADLFPKVDKAVDGDDCDHDCDSCVVHYPKNFKIDESDLLYGYVKGWSTHVLVATGKTDWVRDVSDEKGSVMQAIGNAKGPENGVRTSEPPLTSLPAALSSSYLSHVRLDRLTAGLLTRTNDRSA